MLIIARTAAYGDRPERLVEAARRSVRRVNLEKEPLHPRLSQAGNDGGKKGACKALAAMTRIDGEREYFRLIAGAPHD